MNTANTNRDDDFGGPVCLHCQKQIDAAIETVIDCEGETYCSTLCATLVVRLNHGEDCKEWRCGRGLLTLQYVPAYEGVVTHRSTGGGPWVKAVAA